MMRSTSPARWEEHHGTLMATGFDQVLKILNDKSGFFSNVCSVLGPIPGLAFKPRGGNDPAHFEQPERFDIDRPGLRDHTGFGRGVHGCLGEPLGRMEARIAIERLLARVKDIRISEEHHGPPGARRYRFEPTCTFRSLCDLFIEFSPASGEGL